jgi:hypothetical protein
MVVGRASGLGEGQRHHEVTALRTGAKADVIAGPELGAGRRPVNSHLTIGHGIASFAAMKTQAHIFAILSAPAAAGGVYYYAKDRTVPI